MAVHEVKLLVSSSTYVVNADIELEVKSDGKKLGTLEVSKGGVAWKPKHAHKSKHMDWKPIADFIEQNGR